MYYLEGGLLTTAVISGIIILTQVVVYAGLIAVMPRAGGDYVWQSRILGGGIGFVLAVTGWWFILWLWTPLYADMLRHEFFVPLLGILGLQSAADYFAWNPNAWFIVSLITVGYVTLIITLGMRAYARVQKICFWVGMAGLAIVFLFLLFGSPAPSAPASTPRRRRCLARVRWPAAASTRRPWPPAKRRAPSCRWLAAASPPSSWRCPTSSSSTSGPTGAPRSTAR
jgi:amino acid transporter